MTARENIPVTINLFRGRTDGASCWELPPWGDPLGCGVFPLLVRVDEHFIPVGTSFCISHLGFVATATHAATQALHYHPRGERLLQRSELPSSLDLGNIGLAVLHNWLNGPGRLQVNIWSLEGMQGAQPTDVLFGFARRQEEFPYLPFKLSFELPRIGSKVICVGYCDTEPRHFPLADLSSGNILDWPNYYKHKLLAVEGTVRHIFTQGTSSSYVRGACFEIDAEVRSGMSGGPVFNEYGHVCGVISATASLFFQRPSTLVSLFYPALMTELQFGFQTGQVRMNVRRPLLQLIQQGAIDAGGTESMVTVIPEGEGWRVGPLIHMDDDPFVYDDFDGFQSRRPATKETREHFRPVREGHGNLQI